MAASRRRDATQSVAEAQTNDRNVYFNPDPPFERRADLQV
jgi:hypothetical protein